MSDDLKAITDELKAELPSPPRKPARKWKTRKRAAAPAPKATTPPSELVGMNATACCDACSPDKGCFISGGGSCVHPNKGGLQAAHLANYETVKRFERAKKYLAQAKLDKVYA